jgi:alkyl hydroperoxide reductase subunit F
VYDLAILGGGPAGIAAGVYAARKRLKTVLITAEFGGQSSVSTEIQNWIGTVAISGEELAKQLEAHLRAYAGDVVAIKEREFVTGVSGDDGSFTITTAKASYGAKAILIATGSSRKKLEVPGADALEHRGISYCASCDGPLFEGQDTVVIGGGNAAFETAAQLLSYAKSVTLLHRSAEFRADPVTVEKVLAHPKMRAVRNAEIIEVSGETFVNSIAYKDKDTGERHDLPTGGIFVEIGSVPNTSFLEGVVERNQYGAVVIDAKTQRTSKPGIWAAGDATDVLYHQNNISAGDAVKALEDIYLHLHAK